MTDKEHLEVLKQGVEVWNQWRKDHPDVVPNLIQAELRECTLVEVTSHAAHTIISINLSGANLCRANLVYSKLIGANLSNANLRKANLSNTFLVGSNLSGADLSEANLSEANLEASDLSETNFSGTDLSTAKLDGLNLTRTFLRTAKISGTSLKKADLSKMDLSKLDLSGTDLRGANLSGANLSGANLTNALLQDTNLSNADLSEADFHHTWHSLQKADFAHPNQDVLSLIELYLPHHFVNRGDLSETNFTKANLSKANLSSKDLRKTLFEGATLNEANLSLSNLSGANLSTIHFKKANLSGANLSDTNLSRTDLAGANLEGADLSRAILIQTNLNKAVLNNCRTYGTAVWDVQLEEAKQNNLIITSSSSSSITVDNLEVAQFIYLIVDNRKIRTIIDTITSKVVLILGSFTFERKSVLDALREELRKQNYSPVLFDFEKPSSRDFTETVRTLAHLSRFVLADLTDSQSTPQELQAIIPNLEVPVVPLLEDTKKEYAMFADFWKYHWVLPIHVYTDQTSLLKTLKTEVIEPAENKVDEIALDKGKRLQR